VAVANVSCGSYHTAVVTAVGDLFTFGLNKLGQLGTGDLKRRCHPTKIHFEGSEAEVRIIGGRSQLGKLNPK